jgi:hypothetical protein
MLKQKMQIWVNFVGPWNGKAWFFLCSFGIYELLPFGIIYTGVGILCYDKSGNPVGHRLRPQGGSRVHFEVQWHENREEKVRPIVFFLH